MVLKPDKPLVTSDVCFLNADPGCHIYHTFTDVPLANATGATSFRAHYIFSDEVTPLTESMLYHPTLASRHFYYDWYSGAHGIFPASTTIAAGYEGHVYAEVVPMLSNSWAVIGEIAKYVPLARKRITTIGLNGEDVFAVVAGVAGEDVRVCALHCWKDCLSGTVPSTDLVCHTAHFKSNKDVRVDFSPVRASYRATR